ncbi:MAG: hypothetical protein FD161_2987 [Limisphaerales bacterium]|nr:MAG: hypothetical protein FD161_2987 [Limisphaerales bacterium]KAG0508100.1 MAG: hypothetical protein E1N63_2694 [Limisphaerales bacterium]TXT53047.1 MAG: hypothetical protein FD140_155 [Limisphaerales bacterium]
MSAWSTMPSEAFLRERLRLRHRANRFRGFSGFVGADLLTVASIFPLLMHEPVEIREASPEINCYAHAAGVSQWMQCDCGNSFWPEGVTRSVRWQAYAEAFQALGFRIAAQPVAGRETVALYADKFGICSHAARHLNGHRWESKLGANPWVLTGHSLQSFECRYGQVSCYLQRKSA